RAERLGALQEHVRMGLSPCAQCLLVVAVETRVEKSREPRELEDLAAVAARGDEPGAHATRAERLHQRDSGGERLHAALVQAALEERVLARGERLDFRLRQRDAACTQEAAHALDARLSVDVGAVVRALVERLEGAAAGAALEELVEKLLPGGGVHARRARHDPVEVEDRRLEAHAAEIAIAGLSIMPPWKCRLPWPRSE